MWFGSINIPQYVVSIIAIIALIAFAFTIRSTEVMGIAGGLILLFFAGIFVNGNLTILAVILLIAFIIYEYSEGKKHGGQNGRS